MSEQDHEQLAPLLAVYRALDEAQRRRVEAHVQTCPACARQLAAFRAVDRQLSGLREHDRAHQRVALQMGKPGLAAFRARRDAVAGREQWWRRVGGLEKPRAVVGSLAALVLLLAIAGLLATWFAVLRQSGTTGADPSPPKITCMDTGEVVDVIPEFELVSRRDVAADADAVFVGTVTNITCDGWNQDGGGYWDVEMDEVLPRDETTVLGGSGIPADLLTEDGQVKVAAGASASVVHQVMLRVEDILLDEVGLDEEAVLTVLGNSPQGVAIPEHDLQLGERVLVYVQQKELAWRDAGQPPQVEVNQNGAFLNVGRLQVLTFAAGYPPLAYLRETGDGLFIPQSPSPDLASGPLSLAQAAEELAAQRGATGFSTAESSVGDGDLGRVAYVQDGNIWMRQLPDGAPRQLTDGGNNGEPRWSPSGQWLAFRKDKLVWVLNIAAPQEARSLQTTASDVEMGFSWAPTEDILAYTAGNKLQFFEARSGAISTLVSLPDDGDEVYRLIRPLWRPNGSAIAYEQYRIPGAVSDTFQGEHGIWLIEVDNSETTQLFDSGIPERGEAVLVGWTSDGGALLFWQGDVHSASLLMDGAPLYALRVDGSEGNLPIAISVPAAGQGATPMLMRRDFVAPAPHSSEVAIVLGGGRDTWGNKQVGGASPQTKIWRSYTPEDRVAISPAWSPDGTRLAVVTMPDNAATMGEAMRARRIEVWEGGEQRPLTDDPAYRDENPMWSAGGNYILFARLDQNDRASLWLVPAAGGEAYMVVDRLSPPPAEAGWPGVYGYVDWAQHYAWWRNPVAVEPAPAGADQAPFVPSTPPSTATRASP